MSDIVERARKFGDALYSCYGVPEQRATCNELADEIERLRKQLMSDINAETEIERLESEIERLQAEIDQLRGNLEVANLRLKAKRRT